VATNHFFFESTDPQREKELAFAELRKFAVTAGWSVPISNEVELILEEWWANLLNYAFAGIDHPLVSLRIESNQQSATIEIRDNGIAFDPATYPDPDLSLPLEQRPIGGLGIFMMKRLSNGFVSQRTDEQNILRIRKDLAHPVLGRAKA
jgi:serine/threonine-protein kinase RsbW